jgi:tetratricopeptide (TPR) repeat protein
MKWAISFLFLAYANIASASIDGLISAGKLSEALDSIQAAYGNANDKPEHLFVAGMVDQSGENSEAILKDFINQNPHIAYLSDWARLVIGKYYIAQNLNVAAEKQFKEISPSSNFSPEASYLSAKCYLLTNEYDEAFKAFQLVIDNYAGKKNKGKPISPNYFYYWAILGQAESKMAIGKYTEAEKLYDQLLDPELDNDIFPLALLDLAKLSQETNKPEKVEHYLNLYKDQYGSAPLDLAKIAQPNNDLQTSIPAEKTIEKYAGNKYYIQIGIFAKKQNADKSAAIYHKSGYRTTVEEFSKQDQKFYRVILGSYSSKQEANFVKERLEKSAGEKYALLVR